MARSRQTPTDIERYRHRVGTRRRITPMPFSGSQATVLPDSLIVAVASQHLALLPAQRSITAIDHAIAALPATVPTAIATISAAIAAPIETRKHAGPASCNAAGENVNAPWSRAIAAAIHARAHVTHLLRLSGPVVLGVRHWRVVHLGCCSGGSRQGW